VVRLDQPYRNYAVDLLAPQHYPKNGGEPYDDCPGILRIIIT